MILARPFLAATLLAAVLAGPAPADESGSFVVRLGRDTTGVETYKRGANRLEVDQVGRVPRVLKRHFVFDYAPSGEVTRIAATVTVPGAPAGAPAFQQTLATFTADSMMMESRRDTVVQRLRTAVPKGAMVVSLASPWSVYEAMTMRLARQKADSLRSPFYFLGGPSVGSIVVRRMGADSVEIQTDNDLYHTHVDKAGRLLHLRPIKGTGQYTVDRVQNLDLPGTAAAFAAREQKEGTLGALSTRDTVRASAGGASLWIDYGRPSKRGRTIFGNVVPWGEVWRTGANAATQFRTDKALEIGGVTVPAGFYTLWTIPSATGWKLVINGETGQWGTAHKAERDLFTVDMSVAALSEPVERFTIGVQPGESGGELRMDWDTTRASVPFTVKP